MQDNGYRKVFDALKITGPFPSVLSELLVLFSCKPSRLSVSLKTRMLSEMLFPDAPIPLFETSFCSSPRTFLPFSSVNWLMHEIGGRVFFVMFFFLNVPSLGCSILFCYIHATPL